MLPEGVPSHWAVYFDMADTDASCARVVELGGAVVMPAGGFALRPPGHAHRLNGSRLQAPSVAGRLIRRVGDDRVGRPPPGACHRGWVRSPRGVPPDRGGVAGAVGRRPGRGPGRAAPRPLHPRARGRSRRRGPGWLAARLAGRLGATALPGATASSPTSTSSSPPASWPGGGRGRRHRPLGHRSAHLGGARGPPGARPRARSGHRRGAGPGHRRPVRPLHALPPADGACAGATGATSAPAAAARCPPALAATRCGGPCRRTSAAPPTPSARWRAGGRP